MPTYRVTDPNTNKTVKLTGDSPPTEQELENIFSTINKQQPQQQEVGLPNLSQVEQKISQRPSAMRDIVQNQYKPSFMNIVRQTMPQQFGMGLQPAYELAESIPANIGLALQRGKPQDIPKDIMGGITGQRPAQVGDIIRTTGFGGKYNETLARLIGMTAMGALPDVLSGGELQQGIKQGIKQSPIADLVSSVKRKAPLLKVKNKENLALEARDALINKKTKLIDSFGKQYTNIIKNKQGKQISLVEPLNNLSENADNIINTLQGQEDLQKALSLGDPMAKRVMNLVNAVTDPDKNIPQTLSLSEADGLQKYIRQLPSIRTKLEQAYKKGFEQVNWTNAERILLDFASDIKKQILDLSPELGALKMNYGQVMTDIKRIRSTFAWGKTIKNMENFHTLDPEIRSAIERILPSNIINKIKDLSNVTRISNLLKKMGIGIGVGTGIGIGTRMLRK